MNELLQQFDALKTEIQSYNISSTTSPLEKEVFDGIKANFTNWNNFPESEKTDEKKVLLIKKFLIFKAHQEAKIELAQEYTRGLLEVLKNTQNIDHDAFIQDIKSQRKPQQKIEVVDEEKKVYDFVNAAFTKFSPESAKSEFINIFAKTYFSFIKDDKYKTNYARFGGFFSEQIHPQRFKQSLNVWDQKSLIDLIEQVFAKHPELRDKLKGGNFEISTIQKVRNPKPRQLSDSQRQISVRVHISEKSPSTKNDPFMISLGKGGDINNFLQDPKNAKFIGHIDSLAEYLIGNDTKTLELFRKNKETVRKNILTFIRLFADLESRLGRLDAHELSTAKGFYQFLTGVVNGKNIDVVDMTRYPDATHTSFGIAMNQIQKFLKESQGGTSPYKGELEQITKDSSDIFYDLRFLSGELQSVIFISQLIQRSKTPVTGNGGEELRKKLLNSFFNGDIEEILGIYATYHHTEQGILQSENVLGRKKEYTNKFSGVHGTDKESVLKILGIPPKEQQIPSSTLQNAKNIFTSSETKISDPNIENIIKEILKLLGYDISGDIKTLLKKFQEDASLPEPTGNFGLKTKETLGKIFDEVIHEKHPKITKQQLEEILKKFPISQKKAEVPVPKIEPIIGEKLSPKILGIQNVSLQKTPAFYFDHLFRNKKSSIPVKGISQTTSNDIVAIKKVFEDNKEILEKMFRELGAPGYYQIAYRNLGRINERFGSNYAPRIVLYYLDAYKKGTLPQIIESYTHAQKLISEGKLEQIEKENQYWRMDEKEIGDDSKKHFLVQGGRNRLVEVCSRFQKKVKEIYKISEGYTMRPVINSFIRTRIINNNTSGSSPISAHMFGVGIDISHMDFDIIKGSEYTTISDKIYSGKVPENTVDKSKLAIHARNILIEVLLEMDIEGKLILTQEGTHPHITIL